MRIGSISFRRLDSSLIEALLQPEAYTHPVESIEMIETHISWVILTGPFAYKIKKPIQLGFLDFRELESRHFYCQEELRLNRAWAPDIYLDVVSVCMVSGRPVIGGKGTPIEYAVRMRQFDQSKRLDVELAEDGLSVEDMDELAVNIASRHAKARLLDADKRDEKLEYIRQDMWDNLDALDGILEAERLQMLRNWTAGQLETLEAILARRIDEGFIRECHGDLHLSNLVRLPGGITAFDCIEFSAELRYIDVMCDIAFLIMDMVSRQRTDLAYRFLNRYLERTGDYESMALFTLYFVYRCLVRAKVAAIRSQERDDDGYAKDDLRRMQKYCEMALAECVERSPALIVMHGLSGSGKTWLSSQLMSALPAVRVRSDIERKRMFGLDESSDSGSDVAKGIYTDAANKKVYDRIHDIARKILESGHDVILDAAYLELAERDRARRVAAECGAGFKIVHAEATQEVLRHRIRLRAENQAQASEADLAVLDHQLDVVAPISDAENGDTIHWDTGDSKPIEELLALIQFPGPRPSRTWQDAQSPSTSP
jgi:aminoglycoside phosphotransferase family enzyme/predicted kinase